MVAVISLRLVCSAVLVSLLVLALSSSTALARSVDGMGRLEKLLSSSSSSSSSLASPLAAFEEHSLKKRAAFDHTCKGIYDRELFKKLDRVCEDCYNLYRKPFVATDCRKSCFGNPMFDTCVVVLGYNVVEYYSYADFLRYK